MPTSSYFSLRLHSAENQNYNSFMCVALAADPKLNKHIMLSKIQFFNWFDICFSQRGNISFFSCAFSETSDSESAGEGNNNVRGNETLDENFGSPSDVYTFALAASIFYHVI